MTLKDLIKLLEDMRYFCGEDVNVLVRYAYGSIGVTTDITFSNENDAVIIESDIMSGQEI